MQNFGLGAGVASNAAMAETSAYVGGQTFVGGAGQAAVPQAVPTLSRALSTIDALNKHLSQLSQQSHQLAVALGGPFPTADAAPNKGREPSSAMELLNDQIETAHRITGDISACLGAMSRALGA